MPKFFVKNSQVNDNKIIIIGEDVNHIKNVLRKNIGDTLEICDKDNSKNYLTNILELDKDQIICDIMQELNTNTESNVFINVFQGLPKSDKMELIIQKSIELGASKITPVAMKRCVVKLSGKDEEKKITRWQKISEVASKQCGRNIIPKIENVCTIKDICDNISKYDVVLVAYENEKDNILKIELEKLKNSQNKNIKVAIVIGPEGGIEPEEIEKLSTNGAKIVTLGNRILRTETASLNMISIINYELES